MILRRDKWIPILLMFYCLARVRSQRKDTAPSPISVFVNSHTNPYIFDSNKPRPSGKPFEATKDHFSNLRIPTVALVSPQTLLKKYHGGTSTKPIRKKIKVTGSGTENIFTNHDIEESFNFTEKRNNIFVPKGRVPVRKKLLRMASQKGDRSSNRQRSYTRKPYSSELNYSFRRRNQQSTSNHVTTKTERLPLTFQYIVDDEKTQNFQTRQEETDSLGVVRGCYQILEPTGYVRTVTYIADERGYRILSVVKNTDKIPCSAPNSNGKPTPFQRELNRNFKSNNLLLNNGAHIYHPHQFRPIIREKIISNNGRPNLYRKNINFRSQNRKPPPFTIKHNEGAQKNTILKALNKVRESHDPKKKNDLFTPNFDHNLKSISKGSLIKPKNFDLVANNKYGVSVVKSKSDYEFNKSNYNSETDISELATPNTFNLNSAIRDQKGIKQDILNTEVDTNAESDIYLSEISKGKNNELKNDNLFSVYKAEVEKLLPFPTSVGYNPFSLIGLNPLNNIYGPKSNEKQSDTASIQNKENFQENNQSMIKYINDLREKLFSSYKDINSLKEEDSSNYANFPFVLLPISSFIKLRKSGVLNGDVNGFGAVIHPKNKHPFSSINAEKFPELNSFQSEIVSQTKRFPRNFPFNINKAYDNIEPSSMTARHVNKPTNENHFNKKENNTQLSKKNKSLKKIINNQTVYNRFITSTEVPIHNNTNQILNNNKNFKSRNFSLNLIPKNKRTHVTVRNTSLLLNFSGKILSKNISNTNNRFTTEIYLNSTKFSSVSTTQSPFSSNVQVTQIRKRHPVYGERLSPKKRKFKGS